MMTPKVVMRTNERTELPFTENRGTVWEGGGIRSSVLHMLILRCLLEIPLEI